MRTEGSGTLFTTTFGHAPEGHAIDHIWHESRGQTYLAYVRGLDQAIAQWRGTSPSKRINDIAAALSAMLDGLPRYAENKDDPKNFGRKVVGFASYDRASTSWADISPEAIDLADADVPRSEEGCCQHIRDVATKIAGVTMDPFEPDSAVRPWADYYRDNSGWMVLDAGERDADRTFHEILSYAVKWSQVALPQKKP